MQLPEGPVIICPPFVYIAAVILCIKIAISKGGLGKSWKNLDPAHYILFVENGNVKLQSLIITLADILIVNENISLRKLQCLSPVEEEQIKQDIVEVVEFRRGFH